MKKENLQEFCKEIGISCVGITSVGPYEKLRGIIKERLKNGYYTGMEEPVIEHRIDPRFIMNDAKSIIVCAFPYHVEVNADSNLSKYCYGKDYHIVVKEKLNSIGEYLNENIESFNYKVFTDNGPLVDRYLAYLSGIGYFGINNNIITDDYGSYIFIGYIVCNYKFEYDKPLNKTCIKCGACIKACPGNAILGNFEMNPRRCISYITQKKEDLTEEEKINMQKNKKVFGCDVCQIVCPHNKDINETDIEDFRLDLMLNIEPYEINSISNKEFKRKYKEKAFSWRGKNIIKRNLDIIEGK